MKTCTKCKVEKELICFGKHKSQKDGLNYICKDCVNNIYIENKIKIDERNKTYYLKNKNKVSEKNKIYRESNKTKIKIYYQENKKILSEKNKKYYQENKNKIHLKRYYNINKNPLNKLKYSIRCIVSKSFKRGKNNFNKKYNSQFILGCSIEEFTIYIQSKFIKGMTLENYGEWHLDHIVPLATAKTEEDVIKLNHYTNFQPLWAKDNLSKSDKIIEKQLVLL